MLGGLILLVVAGGVGWLLMSESDETPTTSVTGTADVVELAPERQKLRPSRQLENHDRRELAGDPSRDRVSRRAGALTLLPQKAPLFLLSSRA